MPANKWWKVYTITLMYVSFKRTPFLCLLAMQVFYNHIALVLTLIGQQLWAQFSISWGVGIILRAEVSFLHGVQYLQSCPCCYLSCKQTNYTTGKQLKRLHKCQKLRQKETSACRVHRYCPYSPIDMQDGTRQKGLLPLVAIQASCVSLHFLSNKFLANHLHGEQKVVMARRVTSLARSACQLFFM